MSWEDPEGGGGGGGGGGNKESRPPPPPPPPPHTHTHTHTHTWNCKINIFAMLKFSIRPLLGIWTPPEKKFLDVRVYKQLRALIDLISS